MPTHTFALDQCLDQVTDSAPMALERCLDHVVTALQQAEGNSLRSAERAELAEAWRELLRHKAAWCRLYPEELRAAFRFAVQPGSESAARAPRADATDFEHLSLVDDAQVMQAIETSRLVQHVMPLLENPVSELDALVSSAMGLQTVQADRNPVRPEIFAQALRELFGKASVKAATGSLWMKYLAEPLGMELKQLYGGLVEQLRHANVQAAGYGRVSGAGARQPGHADFAQTQAPAQEGAAEPAPTVGSANHGPAVLREFLRRADGAHASQTPPQAYYAGVREELARLQRQAGLAGQSGRAVAVPSGYRELPAVDRPSLPVGVDSALSPKVWGSYGSSHERSMVRSRLRQDVTRMSQVLGLELVREVVDRVARNPRLLTPVREAIVALEPSLLRLAMVDPRFFSEEHHPGRHLMERVAQRSFKYNDEFSHEFALFFSDVCGEFNALNELSIADARPFESALDRLETHWSRQDGEDEGRRRQAVQAVRFAEMRHAEAKRIAGELGQRPDLVSVPQVVQDFLFGPWSLVLAHAILMGDGRQADPGGYRAVISDLLWSVKPEVTLRRPAQLFERVPPLLAKLREGLASLGQDPAEHEPFFQALMKLHHPVLKLRRAKSRRDARESGMAPLGSVETPAHSGPQPLESPRATPDQPWMSQSEIDAAGFQETLPTDLGELREETAAEEPEQPAAVNPVAAGSERAGKRPGGVDPKAVLAQLREGDWVDLYSKRRWHRAQLVWAASRGTLFMFVSHGGRPHSMTRRICERLISDRYLRPVHAHPVVAHALDALERELPAS